MTHNFGLYNTIDTKEKLKALSRYLTDGGMLKSPHLGIDTETNGLDIHKSTVVGVSLAASQNVGFYIPLLQWVPDQNSKYSRTKDKIKYEDCYKTGQLKCVWSGDFYPEFVTPEEYDINKIMPAIPLLIESWTSQAKLRTWNGNFDANMLKTSFGVDITPYLAVDGALLVHCIDENDTNSLKGNIPKYAKQLGINSKEEFAVEKRELLGSIIVNGGDKAGEVWRAAPEPQAKYASSDATYTFGICQAAMEEFKDLHGKKGLQWFFKEEVMPLSREVITKLKYKGMYVHVPHFEALLIDTQGAMIQLEDDFQKSIKDYLMDFTLGKVEEVSSKRLLTKIIELEGLEMPTKTNKKTGKTTPSLAKDAVKKAYQKNPHWLYGHILGTEEMQYSKDKLDDISKELHYYYLNKENVKLGKPLKRYPFNINSDNHLKWLFIECLGINPKILPTTEASTRDKRIVSVAADVLREFMLPRFPWVAKLLSYKKLLKLESTYIRPVVRSHTKGWIFPDWKQNGTGSGRASCKAGVSGGVNLQTLPRAEDEYTALHECEKCGSEEVKLLGTVAIITDVKCLKCNHVKRDVTRPSVIKEGFIAPPGYKVVAADYSSLEPRCFAEVSGSDSLKEVYSQGLDLYSHVYNLMFDREGKYSAHPDDTNFLKKVAKDKRNMAKVGITLAIPYGAGPGQVASSLDITFDIMDEETGLPIKIPNVKEGKRIRDLYLDTFPELRAYMEECETQATSRGYVETLMGRRRHLIKAKVIQKVLVSHGFDFLDLEGCKARSLTKKDCSPVSTTTGVRVDLTSGMLEEIRSALGIRHDVLSKKNNWALIRGLLKSDLNLAKNHRIQGLAAHVTNMAMLQTERKLREFELDAWIVAQVHDELILYATEGHAKQVAEILQSCMEKNMYTALVSVPMEAEPIIADNLKDAK